MTGEPVAYIRRSAHSRSDPGDLSREFQTEKVRELAGVDAFSLRVIDADWRRSAATDQTERRLAFLGLLAEVEAGRVSTLYAYSTDRLARSVEWAARLLNACRRAGTPIVTSEGRFEPDNPMTDQLFYFQAVQNEGYSRQAQQKRRATVERQRARGDRLGPKFYGELPGESADAVLAAFEATGSAHGAAVRLNTLGVKPRRGGTWGTSVVRALLVRHGRIPALGTRGAKPRAPFAFYRLLRCHCTTEAGTHRVLTGVVHRYGKDKGRSRVIYRCVNASTDKTHGRATIAEREILEWAKVEASRLRLPDEQVAIAAEAEAELRTLATRRTRTIDAYVDEVIDKAERDRRLAAIDAERDRYAAQASAITLPQAIEWDRDPAAINAVLRALWSEVRLDDQLRPIEAVWILPELRLAA